MLGHRPCEGPHPAPVYGSEWHIRRTRGRLLLTVRRSLLSRDFPGELCHNGHHWLPVLYDLFPLGRVLVINLHLRLHLRPHLRNREWLQEVRQMARDLTHLLQHWEGQGQGEYEVAPEARATGPCSTTPGRRKRSSLGSRSWLGM